MLLRIIFLFLVSFMVCGCGEKEVPTAFDLSRDFSVTLYVQEQEYPYVGAEYPFTEDDKFLLKESIQRHLPRMEEGFGTYPVSTYSLKQHDLDRQGEGFEDLIFLGSNWLGDGRGISDVDESEMSAVFQIFDIIIANKILR